MGLAWETPASLLDYLPACTLVAIDERRQCLAHGHQWYDHAAEHHGEVVRAAGGEPPLPLPGVLHRPIAAALAEAEAFTGFDLAELHESDRHPNDLDLSSRPLPAHPNQFGRLAEQIKGHLREKARLWIVSAQPSRAVALLE